MESAQHGKYQVENIERETLTLEKRQVARSTVSLRKDMKEFGSENIHTHILVLSSKYI